MFWLDETEAPSLIEQLWEYVDFLKLAQEEAQWLFNTADAGAIFYRLDSVEGVLISNGDARVSYCLCDRQGTVDPPKVDVKETTGAGDAFIAGFVHQLCQQGITKLSDPQAARSMVQYACAVGGLTTTKSGAIAAQPTPQEVEALLEKA
jgi:fructokinase